jgi:hypothetical protein
VRRTGLALLIALGATLAGCGGDVCRDYAGKTCIALEVRGRVDDRIDVLRVQATHGFSVDAATARPDRRAVALPLTVAVLPGAEFAGEFRLEVIGLLSSIEIGRATVESIVPEPGMHVLVVAELAAPFVDSDLAQPDGGSPGDQGDEGDGAMPGDMAEPPPTDSECGGPLNMWAAASKNDVACNPRKAVEVDKAFWDANMDLLLDGDPVGIARAPNGKVGIVYGFYGENGPDQRGLVVSSFTGDTFPPAWTTTRFGAQFLGDRQGVARSIAAAADGKLDVCYLDASDSGNLIGFTVLDTMNAFSAGETVALGQGTSGSVATAIDGQGRIVCAYFNQSTNDVHSKRRVNGVWDTMPQIMKSGTSSTLTGRGKVALAVAEGNVFGAHHQGVTGNGAVPLYASFDGSAWSNTKTVDNSTGSTMKNFGASVDVAVFGTRTAMVYLAQNAGGKWDLRLATFSGAADPAVYEDLDIDLSDTALEGRAAVDFDRWGQIHVAYIVQSGALIHQRQYPDGMGGKKWLSDTVDIDVGPGSQSHAVDLHVDSRGRPHIAYYSGTTGKLMYATRTDR